MRQEGEGRRREPERVLEGDEKGQRWKRDEERQEREEK